MQEIFSFRQQGVDANGTAIGDFHASGHVPHLTARLAEMGINLPATLFAARKLETSAT
jgi:pilus assembly protein CpaF